MRIIPFRVDCPEVFLIEAAKEVEKYGGYEPYMAALCDKCMQLVYGKDLTEIDEVSQHLVIQFHHQKTVLECYEHEFRVGSVINGEAIQQILAEQKAEAKEIH